MQRSLCSKHTGAAGNVVSGSRPPVVVEKRAGEGKWRWGRTSIRPGRCPVTAPLWARVVYGDIMEEGQWLGKVARELFSAACRWSPRSTLWVAWWMPFAMSGGGAIFCVAVFPFHTSLCNFQPFHVDVERVCCNFALYVVVFLYVSMFYSLINCNGDHRPLTVLISNYYQWHDHRFTMENKLFVPCCFSCWIVNGLFILDNSNNLLNLSFLCLHSLIWSCCLSVAGESSVDRVMGK